MARNKQPPLDAATKAKMQNAGSDLAKALKSPPSLSLALSFTEVPVPDVPHCPDARISHAIQYLGADAKIIFHIKGVAPALMEKLSDEARKICREVLNPIPASVSADVGRSPYPSQWDFVTWGIPLLRSRELEAHILARFKSIMRGPV